MRRTLIVLFVLACLAVAFSGTPQALAKSKAPAASPVPSASPTQNPLERIATLQQTVKDNPNDVQAREELGALLVENGKPADGRDQLENAVRLGSTGAQVWYFIGIANQQLGDSADAVTAFEKAETADPANQAVLSALADSYIATNRMDDAERIAKRAIVVHPEDAFGYVALATVQLDKGQLDAGRASLNKALTIDPKDERALMLLGRTYMADKKPDPDLAIAQFDLILKNDPQNPQALHAKSEALAMKNDVPGAVALLQQIVKLEPGSVEPEDDIGQLYLSKHMTDQARQAFAQAAKDHPKSVEPYVMQAQFDVSEKRYDQAAKEYEQALTAVPDDERTMFEYGRLELVNLKNAAKAQELFEKIAAKDPNNADVLYFLGQTYAVEGKWTLARDEFRKTFDLTHSYAPLFNLGLAFFNLKDYRSARDAFEALASHGDPKHPDPQLWYMLGETDRMMGDKKAAVAAYKTFLALVPSGEGATKARGYIKQLSQ